MNEFPKPLHFKTTFRCIDVPVYAFVQAWETKPLTIVIDSYELTAQDADQRACRLFSKLGAIGCIASHTTFAA